jgi:hypothetical protein
MLDDLTIALRSRTAHIIAKVIPGSGARVRSKLVDALVPRVRRPDPTAQGQSSPNSERRRGVYPGAAQAAGEAVIMAAEDRGPLMHARIGVLRALNRNVERVFNPSPKDTHWGRRKLKRDE